jgi:hypothetical protein
MFDFKWAFTTLIAVYGAGLATYQAWLRYLERYPKVRVTFHPTGMIALTPGVGSVDIVWVHLANVGFVDVFFRGTNCEVEIQGRTTRFILNQLQCDAAFPTALKPGDGFTITQTTGDFWEDLSKGNGSGFIRIRANVWDAVHTTHSSPWRDLDLRKLTDQKREQ